MSDQCNGSDLQYYLKRLEIIERNIDLLRKSIGDGTHFFVPIPNGKTLAKYN